MSISVTLVIWAWRPPLWLLQKWTCVSTTQKKENVHQMISAIQASGGGWGARSRELAKKRIMTTKSEWIILKFTKSPMSNYSFICLTNIFMYLKYIGPCARLWRYKRKWHKYAPDPTKTRRYETQVKCQESRQRASFILVSPDRLLRKSVSAEWINEWK